MRFAAVMRDFIRRPPAAFASGSSLGTWVRVYTYAADLESGGRLPGLMNLDDRHLLGLTQVTRAELAEAVAADLLRVDGADVLVEGYDLEGEAKIAAQRERNRQNGQSGGRPKTVRKPSRKPSGNPPANPAGSWPQNDGEPSGPPLSVSGSVSASGSSPVPTPKGERKGPPDLCEQGLRLVPKIRQPMPWDATLSFVRCFERYPNRNAKARAANVWQAIVDTYEGGEAALERAIVARFDGGMLTRHPYAGEARFRPTFETFLAERRWEDPDSKPDDKERAPSIYEDLR